MSHEADIQDVVRKIFHDHDIAEDTACEILIAIYDALEWDICDLDLNNPDWQRIELAAAKKLLFG
jgi:hypothetical protein